MPATKPDSCRATPAAFLAAELERQCSALSFRGLACPAKPIEPANLRAEAISILKGAESELPTKADECAVDMCHPWPEATRRKDWSLARLDRYSDRTV